MQSLPLVHCLCAILLASLEGIVCPVVMEFVVENFNSCDNYSRVVGEGDNIKGRLTFRKSKHNPDESGRDVSSGQHVGSRQRVVRIPDILPGSLKQEENDPKIVSFSVTGESANFNIKFRNDRQAYRFIRSTALPLNHFLIRWARIYTYSRPVIIAYDKFDTGDIGFKLLDNEDYSNGSARLNELPYIFMRSEIRNEMMRGDPYNLYLRNRAQMKDYEIMFQSEEDLNTFLELFPDKLYDEHKTQDYYFLPTADDSNTSESQDPSKMHGPSDSHDPLDSQETSECRDTSD